MAESVARRDVAVAISKGVFGAIPFVGPLAAEVIGILIPNQRVDRIEALLKALSAKVADFEEERLKKRFTEPGFIDVFEEGLVQASKALSDDRIQYVAALLKNGLSEEDAEAVRHKTLLSLLGELNDAEVILLCSRIQDRQRNKPFFERHASIVNPPLAHMGSPQEEHDKATIHEAHLAHLERLRLLKRRYTVPSKGQPPEFDEKTGTLKSRGSDTTPLARLLLRTIDLIGADEE